MWFNILKRQTKLYNYDPDFLNPYGEVSHFHGSRASKEKLLEEGLKPQGKYISHPKGYTKEHYRDLVKPDNKNKKSLIWAAGKEQGLPLEYGESKENVKETTVDYNSLFDERGMLLPNPKILESNKTIRTEGNIVGIRGKDIDWNRSESPIYKIGTKWYIHNKPIDPDRLVFLTIEQWKKYLNKKGD